jgi:hypothetical protein
MNIKTKFNIISEKMEKMNEHSRSIMRFEGEDSIEGLQESGKIQGRLDMLKLFAELSNYDLATGDDTVK